MEHLTKDTFKKKVFDFEKEINWEFKGDKPCLIDFYADWCGPCKIVAPILEELATEQLEINIYKVDTDKEQEISMMFGIRGIPSLLFIPMNGKPKMVTGELRKIKIEKLISEIL